MSKKIGILTSGGDCPGLNAVIRAVVKCATRKGWEVYGIPHGTDGFINVAENKVQPESYLLKEHGFDIPGYLQGLDVLQFLSGSILGSLSKGDPHDINIQEKIIAGYSKMGLDALIVVGGDGSFDIIYDVAKKGNWNLVAIPKTIDNDVPFTERSVGFDTAVGVVTQAIYDLTFTAASHDRVMVVEVMGRDAGHLALHSGIAGGADIILVPEITPRLNEEVLMTCCHHIQKLRQEGGRKFALVVVAEGVEDEQGFKGHYIGDQLAKRLKEYSVRLCNSGEQPYCNFDIIDTRSTALGHIQRSGMPSAFDRLLATAFGRTAVQLIEKKHYSRLLVWRNGEVKDIPLSEVIPLLRQCHQEKRCSSPIDPNGLMIETAQDLGICLGV